jgi:hypothetical protein
MSQYSLQNANVETLLVENVKCVIEDLHEPQAVIVWHPPRLPQLRSQRLLLLPETATFI